jgi:ketosteroid isomerase-like protein
MTQPLAAPVRGPEGLRELFAPLFAAMPDFGADVVRWGATDDGVMIEIRLSGTLDGKPVTWNAADRLVVRDGLIAERHSYFDPLPVLRAFAKRPLAGARLLRAVLGRGR